MSHPTPTANPDHELPEFEIDPGDLEPLSLQNKPFPPKPKLPEINLQLLKTAFRPMMFGAVGIHALLLFTPLTMTQQAKPKETAEPVKLKRLSDKVLVKSMPKVKVAAAPKKTDLPKVAVASSNPIVIKAPEPEKPKPEDKKTEDKKPEDKKPEDKQLKDSKVLDGKPSDKGEDPSKVDPSKATTDANKASQLKKESQQFESVIVGLNELSNGTEGDKKEKDIDPYLLPQPTLIFPDPEKPKEVVSGIEGYSWISNNTVEQVVANLTEKFSKDFKKTGEYAGGELYVAKIGNSTRFISVFKVTSGSGVMVFQWAKSPV